VSATGLSRRYLPVVVRGGATITATQRLTSRYFPGLRILFKAGANALNELAERAGLLADDYNRLVDYIIRANGDGIIFDAGFADRIEKIDKNTTDPAAGEKVATLVRTLVAIARAGMFSFLDQGKRATEILKPILRGEVGQLQ
jgi:hypothetical protein